MSTTRSAEGALRHSAGVVDQAGRYAPELLGETHTDLSARVVSDLTDTRLSEHFDAADLNQSPGTVWGNASVGTFSSLRELHEVCYAKVNALDAEHDTFDVDKFSAYPDRDLHRELSLRRDRILRGGPIWSWASSSTDDVLSTVASMERDRNSARLTEMADTQDAFVRKMELATTLQEKQALVDEAGRIRFSGEAKIANLIKARTAIDRDDHMFERAQIAEYRLGDSPPDHWSNEDMVDAMTATLAAQDLRDNTAAEFERAFESSKADITAASDNLRTISVSLQDDAETKAALAEQLWSNGWTSMTKSPVPPMPEDFTETELASRLWSIAESYR
jgi:hypothetical protein